MLFAASYLASWQEGRIHKTGAWIVADIDSSTGQVLLSTRSSAHLVELISMATVMLTVH